MTGVILTVLTFIVVPFGMLFAAARWLFPDDKKDFIKRDSINNEKGGKS